MAGVAYVGHDPLNAALLDNKHMFKRQLKALGIPTAPFLVWHPATAPADLAADSRFRATFTGVAADGFIVKPISGRASLHVHFVERAADVAAVAREVFDVTRSGVIVESYMAGREYCVAVCGPHVFRGGRLELADRPFAFAAVERVLDADERVFTSMDFKTITAQRLRVLDRDADGLVIDSLEELAVALYDEFPLRTLVRIDVRADRKGRLHVLEANPKPDLKAPGTGETSLIAAGLQACGLGYDDLVMSILADRIAQMFSDGDGAGQRLLDLVEGNDANAWSQNHG